MKDIFLKLKQKTNSIQLSLIPVNQFGIISFKGIDFFFSLRILIRIFHAHTFCSPSTFTPSAHPIAVKELMAAFKIEI